MDRLEVDDDLRLDLEDETGEGKAIEVHEFEFCIERYARFDIIDGVDLEVGPTGKATDELPTRPAPRSRDEHPTHTR
jgi:hypothetical protein